MRMRFRQTAVYWAPNGADQYGRFTYAAPVEFTNAVRWEDGVSETIDGSGNTVLSGASVFTPRTVVVGGLLYLGKLADTVGWPANPKEGFRAREILSIERVPDIKGNITLTVAMVK